MKKMSILASLALCVTIGGVYAAWNYADKNVSTTYAAMGVSVTGITSQSEKGVLKAVGTNVALQIDDIVNTKPHTTEFVYDANGYFTVTFTANANAPETVLEQGIDLKWYVGLATTANAPKEDEDVVYTYGEYNNEQIYSVASDEEVQIDKVDADTWEDTDGNTIEEIKDGETVVGVKYKKGDVVVESREEKADGTVVFTYRVALTDVMQKITLSEIVLDTQAAHDAYSEIVSAYQFHFHVAEGTVAANP